LHAWLATVLEIVSYGTGDGANRYPIAAQNFADASQGNLFADASQPKGKCELYDNFISIRP